jgi:hypothetical protein
LEEDGKQESIGAEDRSWEGETHSQSPGEKGQKKVKKINVEDNHLKIPISRMAGGERETPFT